MHRVRDEFDVLYRERLVEIVAEARSILRGRADATDVAATAYTRLWAEISEGRADNLYDRLIELTKTEAEKTKKRAQRERKYLGLVVERVVDPDPDTPYETALYREGGTHLAEIANQLTVRQPTPADVRFQVGFDGAVRRLTPKQKDAYILTELRGLSAVEAGELLGINQSAVSKRIARARESIATALTEGGIA